MTLDDDWDARWGARGVRPIGHELRTRASATWIRFHSLPGSTRYASGANEHAEVLRRHDTLLGELVAESTSPDVLVFTCSWSDSKDAVDRDEPIALASPGVHWRSIAREPTAWTHVFVHATTWETGAIDELLRLVADDTAADVIVAPADLAWLYHPYDGGGDVIAISKTHRAALRERHRAWLSPRADGL